MNSICWSIDTSVAAGNPSDCVLYLKIPCRARIAISHAPSQDRDPPDTDPPDTDPLMEESRCRQASVIVLRCFGGSFGVGTRGPTTACPSAIYGFDGMGRQYRPNSALKRHR